VPKFGKRSKKNLDSCHIDLQRICLEVIKLYDFSVICGERSKEAQDKAVREHKSKVVYPNSKHNKRPSEAVDLAPYPIDWNNLNRFILLAGFMLATAEALYKDGEITHILRWGGDWDSDRYIKDHKFKDFPHFELKKK